MGRNLDGFHLVLFYAFSKTWHFEADSTSPVVCEQSIEKDKVEAYTTISSSVLTDQYVIQGSYLVRFAVRYAYYRIR